MVDAHQGPTPDERCGRRVFVGRIRECRLSDAPAPYPRRIDRPPYLITALSLFGFAAISRAIPATRDGFPADFPPMFFRWDPVIGWEVIVPVLLAIGLWVAWPRVVHLRPAAMLAVCVVFAWTFAFALAIQSLPGSHYPLLRPVTAAGIVARPFDRPSEYFWAVPKVEQLGPRGFAQDYPALASSGGLPLHVTTHPPGGLLLLWVLWRVTGRSLTGVALLTALIAALGVIPTWAIAREVKGEGAARNAALLFACSPGVLIYSFTSMDAVFMTAFAVAVAAIVRASRSDGWGVAAGAATAAAMCLTWGALAAIPVAVGVLLLAGRDGVEWPVLLRRAALGLLGFAAAAAGARLALGVNLAADLSPALHNQIAYKTYGRPYWYWWIGNLAAFFVTAGIAQTALFVGVARKWIRDRGHAPGFELVVIATLLVATASTMYKGETDHNWLIFLPMFLACAGAGAEDVRGAAVGGLGQAVATEVLFYTGW